MALPFIIFFVGRSGSSVIMSDLEQHPDVTMRAEVFGEKNLPNGAEQTDENRLAWLEEYWRPWRVRPTVKRAKGFKFQVNRGAPQFDDIGKLFEAIRNHGAKVIYLERADTLRHAISPIRAEMVRQVSAEAEGRPRAHIFEDASDAVKQVASTPIQIPIHRLERAVWSVRVNRGILQSYKEECRPDLILQYEDYMADKLSVLNAICRTAGVDEYVTAPPDRLLKITDDDLSRSVENYDEVMSWARANSVV
ncbi:hypothetical protein ACUN0C_17785 [Faunimonas sp. B44]|uniref:hypothetical protein n=1 Tax=Faunimonas sp. B44 TaxID=3461493 RepID=UPI0040450F46